MGRLLDQRPRTLLVLDDVWESEQLEPFLVGGSACVRLVTTRIPAVLLPDAKRVQVDEVGPVHTEQDGTRHPSGTSQVQDATVQAT
jgi:hypothetical protein